MLHSNNGKDFNIAVQDLLSGKFKLITKSSTNESPTIAPNGIMVLYSMHDGYQDALGAVTLDGRFRMRLPLQDGNVKEPAWSPFLS